MGSLLYKDIGCPVINVMLVNGCQQSDTDFINFFLSIIFDSIQTMDKRLIIPLMLMVNPRVLNYVVCRKCRYENFQQMSAVVCLLLMCNCQCF